MACSFENQKMIWKSENIIDELQSQVNDRRLEEILSEQIY